MPYKWHKTVRIFDFAKIPFNEIGGIFIMHPIYTKLNINIKDTFCEVEAKY